MWDGSDGFFRNSSTMIWWDEAPLPPEATPLHMAAISWMAPATSRPVTVMDTWGEDGIGIIRKDMKQ